MTFQQLVAPAGSMGGRMVRRKRIAPVGLNLPRHLWADAVQADPDGWKAGRFEWSRSHEWGRGMSGYLAFFDETVYLHRLAVGLVPPIGCAERHESRA